MNCILIWMAIFCSWNRINIGNFDLNQIDSEVVEVFDLHRNRFDCLPQSVVKLHNLQSINLNNCGLPPLLEESPEWGIDGFFEMVKQQGADVNHRSDNADKA